MTALRTQAFAAAFVATASSIAFLAAILPASALVVTA